MSLAASWQALEQCAAWEFQQYDDGPLAHLLMHVAVDPAGLLGPGAHATARASVRLVLREGVIFGALVTAPRAALRDVLKVAGVVLAGQSYDESVFRAHDAALAAALETAGHERARINLEHNATPLARPLLTLDQLSRLALHAVRHLHGDSSPAACSTALVASLRRACSADDPSVVGYRSLLDAHAVAFGAAAAGVHGTAPDSLIVYNFIAARSGNARNRAQAMQTLPWLLPMMTTLASGRNLCEAAGILAAIDVGLPLHDAVACSFGVPREVVRWLGRRTLPANWQVDVCRLHRLLTLLSWLPPERRPLTHAAFGDLKALASALTAALDFVDEIDQPASLIRVAPCLRRWLVQRGPLDALDWADDLLDAKDFLRALFEARQARDGCDARAADAWVLAWCAGISVTRLLELSRAWHAAVAARTWASESGEGAAQWPAVVAKPWQFNDRTIVELTSRAQLRTEGQAMAHCVGTYDAVCRSGNSIIVSLRNDTGVSISTAELHLNDSPPRITLGQHRAESNGAPGPSCALALRALLAHLNGAGQHHLVQRRRDFQRVQAAVRTRGSGEHRFDEFAQGAAHQMSNDAVCRSRC